MLVWALHMECLHDTRCNHSNLGVRLIAAVPRTKEQTPNNLTHMHHRSLANAVYLRLRSREIWDPRRPAAAAERCRTWTVFVASRKSPVDGQSPIYLRVGTVSGSQRHSRGRTLALLLPRLYRHLLHHSWPVQHTGSQSRDSFLASDSFMTFCTLILIHIYSWRYCVHCTYSSKCENVRAGVHRACTHISVWCWDLGSWDM